MTTNRIKLFVIAIITLPMLAITAFQNASEVRAISTVTEDSAAAYKAKCAACHGPAAAKFFDVAKTDEEHIETILKGKKGEKPPFMPGFEAKGMTAEQAKDLVTYMRQLRDPAKE